MTVALLLWWGLVAAAAEPQPADHTLIYYNARMALREGQPLEAVKLWLLRNALEDRTGRVSPHDADFGSVTWAALGELGICQDGQPTDEDGAGLWPVALHNWVVRNMGRRTTKGPRPFKAFEVGRQQRLISINDVLSAQELSAVQLSRGHCARPRMALFNAGVSVTADLSDRKVAARLMLYFLEQVPSTVAGERVRGLAAIEARRFDLSLQLTALAAREARLDVRERAQQGRAGGLSRPEVAAMREDAPTHALRPESEPARVLRACVDWPATEWMALSSERRVFLFDHARAYNEGTDALDAVALGVVDELIARGEGAEVARWIARANTSDRRAREAIWGGDRGQRLLALDRESGFSERAVIALHRGVHQLEGGDLQGALRSFAFALQHAPESQAAESVGGLSRRWLSHVASQFEGTSALLATLQELVPARDYAVILEDLMWRAAFHADQASFERGLAHQVGRGALERRLALLQPLASGDVGRFAHGIRDGLTRSPSETLRFLDQLVQRIELEDGDIRASHRLTLTRSRDLVRPLSPEGGGPSSGRTSRNATELVARIGAILEGQGGLGPDASERDHARALSPTGEVFAGSVRLAPADALPWPFHATEVAAPSVFSPITLTPEEWRDASGALVFGWRIDG